MPKIEWDAPGFYYILKYRRVNLGYLSDWREEKIGDPTVSVFGVTNAGYYQLWEFKIRTGNHEGLGPESPIKRSFSGQDAPVAKPENTKVNSVTASSVVIAWKPVTVKKGSVDGYKVNINVTGSILISSTVETRYNEPLYNEDFGKMNDFFNPVIVTNCMEKKNDITNSRYNEHIIPVP